ncbi:MAG TPA: hypothetical protein VJA44_07380 [Acidimicrobiia bacterium]|nr:hypothetical protein [Acidimicrobiia bacterium]
MIDGQRQRRALTVAEQALRALEAGDAARARTAAAGAAALDQVDAYLGFVSAVEGAAADIEAGGGVSPESWANLAGVLGPGPLGAWAAERGR